MIRTIISGCKNYYTISKQSEHYGLDKPVFIVAAITLAIIFVSVYFSSVSGWMDGAISNFGDTTSEVGPDP